MPRASGRGRQLEALEITAVEEVRVRPPPGDVDQPDRSTTY
jgi:hypothetical protein